MTKSGGGDVFGLRPFGDSIKIATQATVDGASAFLGRICLPAAEEFGELLRDRVRSWRGANALQIAVGAQRIVDALPDAEARHAHPRLAAEILDRGSWVEDDQVQRMWGGLLASSCTLDGRDDSNLIFIDLLSRLTVPQVRLLERACRAAEKARTPGGIMITRGHVEFTLEDLVRIMGIDDLHRIDRELDYLAALGLTAGGMSIRQQSAEVIVNPLALQLYARAQGFAGNPLDFYGLSEEVSSSAPEAEGATEDDSA